MAGNDLFVGSYNSQFEAQCAVRLASAQLRGENCQSVATLVKQGQRDSSGLKLEDRTLLLTRFSDFDEYSLLFVPNAAHLAHLFNTRAKSAVLAFDKAQQLMSGENRSSLETPFRLREWIGQHYSHAQLLKELALTSSNNTLSNTFTLAIPVKLDGNIGCKQWKQSHQKRLQQH